MTHNLTTPLSKQDILKLKIGDKVLLSGTIFTARDKAHLYLLKNNFKKIKNAVIYHCGPIIKNKPSSAKATAGKEVIAAGPTTSSRMNPYTPKLIKKYAIKAIIGKGGMDDDVLRSLKGKAVYLSAVGGAAVLYAKAMKVKGVDKPEFGMPEAIWEFEVKDFPVIVSIDAKGNSLYKNIYKKSKKVFKKLVS